VAVPNPINLNHLRSGTWLPHTPRLVHQVKTHLVYFLISLLIGIVLFAPPLFQLASLSFGNELYTHIFLIPIAAALLLFLDRKAWLPTVDPAALPGFFMMAAALLLYGVGLFFKNALGVNDYLSVCLTAFWLWIVGSYVCFLGKKAIRKEAFPLLFLLFMIPIPTLLIDSFISFLQIGSAHAVQMLFDVIDFSYLREGVTFEVPGGFAISVAKECSGIRSSIALLITVIFLGKMFLNSNWRRLVFVLCFIPITIFKNALRITTLTVMASKLDMSWLTNNWLHHSGGIVFYAISFGLFIPILWGLRKTESINLKT